MKKLLLIASALLAFTFFGCTPSTNPDTGKSDVVVGDDTTKDDDTTGDDTTGDDTTGDEVTEKDFWTADTAEGYDFGLGCDYDNGIGIDASSLQAGNILTFYYTLTKVENEWGVYSQLKLAAGYSAAALPSATDVGANQYGQINVSGTSFSYELTEADITAFAAESKDYKRLMVFGHNVILTKITVK